MVVEKQDYINVTKKEFSGETQKLILQQIDEFYRISNLKLKKPKYKVGDNVILQKGTFLHGFGADLDNFDEKASVGVINGDFKQKPLKRHKVTYSVSVWDIQKKISLGEYIRWYSGMSVSYNDKFEVVPYKELDNFVEKMRRIKHFSWSAESTMETRFMPSLARDDKQLAFIFNTRDKEVQKLVKNNLNNDDIPIDVVMPFFHFLNQEYENIYRNNRHFKDDRRIGYIVFGIPRTMIEGVLVGRKFEKNKKILKHIKEKLPQCYICNLDGKVIVE